MRTPALDPVIMVPKAIDAETTQLLTQLAERLPPVDRNEWK